MERFVPILQAITGVFLIIELGLTAYLVTPWGHGSATNFMLFNSVWSLLAIAYLFLVPVYFSQIFHSLAAVVLEWITVIFWFAGSIALAAFIGSGCPSQWCRTAQAATAFGFFLWALFTFFAVIDTISFLRNRNGVSTKSTPPSAQQQPSIPI